MGRGFLRRAPMSATGRRSTTRVGGVSQSGCERSVDMDGRLSGLSWDSGGAVLLADAVAPAVASVPSGSRPRSTPVGAGCSVFAVGAVHWPPAQAAGAIFTPGLSDGPKAEGAESSGRRLRNRLSLDSRSPWPSSLALPGKERQLLRVMRGNSGLDADRQGACRVGLTSVAATRLWQSDIGSLRQPDCFVMVNDL